MKRKIFTGVSSLAAVGLMFLGTGCSSESSSGADHSSLAFSHDHRVPSSGISVSITVILKWMHA